MRHWYFSLCKCGCLVCWLGWVSSQPADQTATHIEWKIPVSHRYRKFSWWWAHSCPKHVDKLKSLKNKRPTWCHLLFYFTSYVLNMFRTLIHPSSGACDYSVELPHWSYCFWFDVCWNFGVVRLEWYPYCWLQPATRIPLQPNRIVASSWWWIY